MTAPASSITASIGWIVDLLLGAFGVLIAVFAVAILGFGLLLGRLSAKNALRTFLGIFILFGAPSISAGLLRSLHGDGQSAEVGTIAPAAAPKLPIHEPAFDPYAGAVAPTGR